MNAKTWIALTLAAAGLIGCGESRQQPADAATGGETPEALKDVLSEEPLDDAVGVAEAHALADAGRPITLRGLVGGIAHPLPDRRAMMTLIDASVPKTCGVKPSGHCQTPWDYCCQPMEDRKGSMASVQVLGPDGSVLRGTLHGLGGLKPFSEVAVRGTVRSVEPGERLIVDAEKIHVLSRAAPAETGEAHDHDHAAH